jgi:hypothetical protein
MPAASCSVAKKSMRICPTGVTPECFHRGSSPNRPGFPLKACGNDGPREESGFYGASSGESREPAPKVILDWLVRSRIRLPFYLILPFPILHDLSSLV